METANLPKALHELIVNACQTQASDVHFEPSKEHLIVRSRILGRLSIVEKLPKSQGIQCIAALKNAANMDVTQRQTPQDGRFQLAVEHQNIDCRLNVMPTIWGEKAVVRLLNTQGTLISLDHLGMLPEQLKIVQQQLVHSHGLILTTGPTGSGKTATLYAMLESLNNASLNISSVEDPVEVPIDGVNQTEVNSSFHRSFAQCLRALLRQDPDILMVGEIRDAETAEVTLQAAQTGHLVLATLHASNGLAAIVRLLQLQCSAVQIASSLRLLMNQRLVTIGKQRKGVFDINPMTEQLSHALLAHSNSSNCWNQIKNALGNGQETVCEH
ncbi:MULTISPECIES: GspE/PulE family protein [Gammaproteobacteria]|uniref:GspE/PulE family protein n=1 Tax=Gammaproteobacteria TaxID=1236 RepID=UPI000DD033B5|nr:MULTISPECIES: ATPase, T2SS/T4P/T4SS family [Gammaproteobacteria]RTE86306.1 type II/IV secretion system protein [Aliidiomarina sp. B3213]TCZ91656.1 type II/IV secretion system protein [Lysobacter sp. N42]